MADGSHVQCSSPPALVALDSFRSPYYFFIVLGTKNVSENRASARSQHTARTLHAPY